MSASTTTRQQLLLQFPQFTSVSGGTVFRGNSIYHALAFKVDKRFSHGLSALLAYTASKLIDDGGSSGRPADNTGSGVQNWNDLRAERSKSLEDVPQRLVFTLLWEVPLGRTGSALKRQALGGWQLNAINTLQSGSTVSLTATVTGGGNRPNVVPGRGITSTTFGVVTATTFYPHPREVQFALRLKVLISGPQPRKCSRFHIPRIGATLAAS